MTADLFATIFVIGSAISSLLTQAVKKVYENLGKEYQLNAIPWTLNNVICLVLMGIALWVGSMVGYDKVIQTLQQLGILPGKKESEGSNGEV